MYRVDRFGRERSDCAADSLLRREGEEIIVTDMMKTAERRMRRRGIVDGEGDGKGDDRTSGVCDACKGSSDPDDDANVLVCGRRTTAIGQKLIPKDGETRYN